jgi:RecA-family ATPase
MNAKTLDELSDAVEAEDAAKAPKPLGLLRQLTRGEWGTKPKPVDALLTLTRKDGKTVPWLPRGTVALLASPGGTGKSTLVMQLVLSVASGVQWLGQFDVPQAGRVCMWSGEDDEEDMHRRAHAVAYEVRAGNQRGIAALPEGWEDNVFRAAVNGEDGRFVDRASDALVETEFFASVLAQVEALQPALVVLDPASRFMGTDENDNAQATRWVTIAEKLKNTTSKPTVLVLVHTGKGKDLDNQEAIRGASALVDGGRWAATLSRRTRDGDEFDILQLRRVKNNRCPPDDGAVLLERDEFGTVKYASAAAESWFAQQLTDLLATGGAKKREAEDAKERAAERAKAEGVDVSDKAAPKKAAPKKAKKAEEPEDDEVPYE